MNDQACPSCPPELRCTCDLTVMFVDPFATPGERPYLLAVEGCPAHKARRAYQRWAEAHRDHGR